LLLSLEIYRLSPVFPWILPCFFLNLDAGIASITRNLQTLSISSYFP
jgi:hypothetical protein